MTFIIVNPEGVATTPFGGHVAEDASGGRRFNVLQVLGVELIISKK